MKFINSAKLLVLSIIITGCAVKPQKTDMPAVSYQLEPAVIVDINNGINKQEAIATVQMMGGLYNIPEVKIINDFRLIKNYWVAETYTVQRKKPKQFWLDSKTGTLTRGYKKSISLKEISGNYPKIKEIKKGVFQLTDPIVINQKNGINNKEAQLILQMYRLLSIGPRGTFYTPAVLEGEYWASKKKGHWGYKTMKHPVLIHKASGDVNHGKVHYKLSRLFAEFQKERKNLFR